MVELGAVPVRDPVTISDIRRDLAGVREWVEPFWRSIDPATFFRPLDGRWSPADHVRHLVKSNRPVAKALVLPRLLLLLRFLPSFRDSRSYVGLRDAYQAALRNGLQAGGYAPRPVPTEKHTAEEQGDIVGTWARTTEQLSDATKDWSERALDRYRLPHPGLGLLTVREMLFFTLYHNTHHALGVASHLRP